MTAGIRTRDLGIDFGGGVGLHDVDLEVPARGVHALIGPNGAGKTTLFSILTGLVPPGRGTVILGGRIAYCPDTPEHEPWLTAAEVVAQSRALCGLPRDATSDRTVLARCGLVEVADRRVGSWSRGMTQRLGIAATIATGADVLVLDEPTSALDPFGQAEVLRLVRELGDERCLVLSSHSLAAVERVADTVSILHRGRLLWQGTLPALLADGLSATWIVRVAGVAGVAGMNDVNDAADLGVLEERLRARPGVVVARRGPAELTVTYADAATGTRRLASDLAAAAVPVVSATPEAGDLDSAFVALVTAHDRRTEEIPT
ncbi:ABC transporter ATP-binding protein [Arsenicicoccus bolidensis]|uniref:ABC transporter ATP-binding protein n=1 Tax=Arsenicicoccus bolidensis TaxID=229480 RepID=A0ABS9Q8B9_9MICO|nr:ABC transporter ATP-binding protein [Arsenicicoccus bolidensis]MCG7323622.1 ABC transporter ATP-binding protein [Arsenicicoccus bolidensis]